MLTNNVTKLVVAILVLAGAILTHGILSNGLFYSPPSNNGMVIYKINRITGATQICSAIGCSDLSH
jgi:hypothetical protein